MIAFTLVPLLAACNGSHRLTAPAQDVAADAALAEGALLTLPDFPVGWSAIERDDDGVADGLLDGVYECLGPDAVELFRSDTKARSATFTEPTDDSTVSQTVVLARAIAEGEGFMTGGSDPEVPACLTTVYREQLPALVRSDGREADTTVGEVTVRALDLGRIGDAAFAYGIAVPLTIDGVTIELHSAFVAVRVGRSVTGLSFQSIIDPTPLERITVYTALAAARLRH